MIFLKLIEKNFYQRDMQEITRGTVFFRCICFAIVLILFSCSRNERVLFEKAEKYFRASRYVEAILAYSNILAGTDEHLRREALYKIALIHQVNLKNYDKAIEIMESYLTKHPGGERSDEILKLLGDIYYKNFQNYDRSIIEYQKLVDNYPESTYKSGVMFNLGKCYFTIKNFSQAIIEYKKLLEEFPRSGFKSSVELEIAACNNLLGKKEEATRQYQHIIDSYANKPAVIILAKYYLASIYEETEQLTKAVKLYRTIQFTYPNPSVIRLKIDRINYRRSIQGRE